MNGSVDEGSASAKVNDQGAQPRTDFRADAVNYRITFDRQVKTFAQAGLACLGLAVLIHFSVESYAPGFLGFVAGALLFSSLGLLAYAVFHPIRVPCTNCGAAVSSHAAWTCGTCKTTNERGRWNSFLNSCGNCCAMPRVLSCPYCSTAIFLEGVLAQKPYAFIAGTPDPGPQIASREAEAERTKKSEREKKREEHAEKVEDHGFKMTDLTQVVEVLNKSKEVLEADIGVKQTIKKWKREVEGVPEQKQLDPVQRELAAYEKEIEEYGFATVEAAQILREKYRVKLANNPEALERVERLIDARLEKTFL